MGSAYKQDIEKAGEWLLNKLRTTNPLRYSQLWNAETGYLHAEGERLGVENFPVMIDLAVIQLEDQGILSRRNLPEEPELIDGNEDYEIFFHHKKLGVTPHYQHMDL